MSRSTAIDLVARYFAALNAGDADAVLALLSGEVAHDTPGGGREIGKEKFRWRLGINARHFRETFADIAIMADEGGTRAAAEFTRRGIYLSTAEGMPQASGQTFSLNAGLFFEIDDGRISRVSDHSDFAALAALLAGGD